MIWSLCVLCVAGALSTVHASPIRKTSRMEDKAAPQEEVNVLMFGVIQLSESLSYVFETTEAKIAKIRQTLKRHEDTLQNLGKKTEQASETEQQIKEVIQLLQAQMTTQQAQTQATKEQINGIEKDEEELQTKVKRLEVYLDNSAPGSIKKLKDRAEKLSNILQGLQLLTQFQKENIETQNEKLSELQKTRLTA